MKKTRIPAIVMLLLSSLASLGVRTFLSPCVHEDGSLAACHGAGQMLLGLGCVLAVLSLLCLFSSRAAFGAYLSAMPVCILGILTPGTIMNLCLMGTMRCHTVMQPAMILLFSGALLCALTGAVLSAGKKAL